MGSTPLARMVSVLFSALCGASCRASGAGSIVVMHQGRTFSVACVSSVVDALLAKGYSFVVPAGERLKTNR